MIKEKVKFFLKKFLYLVRIKQKIWFIFFESTKIDIIKTFPQFLPYSAGNYRERSNLTVQAINGVFPALKNLINSFNFKTKEFDLLQINSIYQEIQDKSSLIELKELFNKYGSDKGNFRNYFYLYGKILSDPNDIRNIFEIGLGTNNTDVVSNMGSQGKPGASLRAFRDYCPNALIFGADIDERVLFTENRIQTFYIDQTTPKTFDELLKKIPDQIDLFIDDGLHSPHANIISLEFGLKKIRKGGWVVIEDIGQEAIYIWKVVAALLPKNFSSHIYRTHDVLLFAVQRID